MQKIKIELVYDVVCSWCPIGHSHIESALRDFEGRLVADIQYLPYELNPDMPEEGEAVDAHIKRRNDWTQDQFENYRESVVAKAKEAGIVYDYDKRTHYFNTRKAHRLIDFAEKFDKHRDIVKALTQQYFTYGMDISNPENLREAGASVGLDPHDVMQVTTDEQDSQSLQQKFGRVQQLQIQRIPTLILNERTIIQGSHSQSFFRQVFADLLDRVNA